jgi:hypothetical protein
LFLNITYRRVIRILKANAKTKARKYIKTAVTNISKYAISNGAVICFYIAYEYKFASGLLEVKSKSPPRVRTKL